MNFGLGVSLRKVQIWKIQGNMIAYLWDIPKRIKGNLFYDPQEQSVVVCTNTRFLEEDYQMDNKPKYKIILDEL